MRLIVIAFLAVWLVGCGEFPPKMEDKCETTEVKTLDFSFMVTCCVKNNELECQEAK